MKLLKPIRSADLVKGGTTIKQGEIFTLGFQLFDSSGNIITLTTEVVTVKIANSEGVIHETTASFVTDHIEFTVNVDIGYGDMRVELKVSDGGLVLQKYPADDWIRLEITKSLDNLLVGGINVVTADEMFAEIAVIDGVAANSLTVSQTAETVANEALAKSIQTQTELDQAILTGDSSPLAGQLSVGGDGTVYTSAQERLITENDKTVQQLAEKATKEELQQISLSYKESYDTLTLLQNAYPTGDVYNHSVLADGLIYTYTTSWVSTGLQANGTGITDKSITPEKTSFFTIGKNKFDKSTVEVGKYIDVNGSIFSSASYNLSDYIEVIPSGKITRSYSHVMVYFDVNKVFVSGVPANGSVSSATTTTNPSNAKYARVNVAVSVMDTMQFEEGETKTEYEAFNYFLDNSVFNENEIGKEDFELLLPKEIFVTTDRTIEIYHSQICRTGNINNFHFQFSCSIGKGFARKWSVTPTTTGDRTLTITVRNNNYDMVAQGTTNIKVVDKTTDIVTPLKVLCIGDSLTNGKPWISEWRTLADTMFGVGKVEFMGTLGNVPNNHEGRSGWSTNDYANTASKSSVLNPFWNPTTSQLDFNYYLSNNGLNRPDIVHLFLGTNDVNGNGDVTAITTLFQPIKNNMKKLVDKILEQWVGTKIFIALPPYWADQNGIGYFYGSGATSFQQDINIFVYEKLLLETFETYNSLVSITPIAPCMDSDFNYVTIQQAVNPRSTIMESIVIDAIHPADSGYMQFTDVIFSHFVGRYI